jgi:hypothetical protein
MRYKVPVAGWTVYDHPSDYPDGFVARRWIATTHAVLPTGEMFVADTLNEIRDLLPPGLTMFPRMEEDDPVILEVWL